MSPRKYFGADLLQRLPKSTSNPHEPAMSKMSKTRFSDFYVSRPKSKMSIHPIRVDILVTDFLVMTSRSNHHPDHLCRSRYSHHPAVHRSDF